MRRFLTLVFLLGLALPAGISISGCVRNPAGNYCNGLGYGPKLTDVSYITLQPQVAGISVAYGQTLQVQAPAAFTCRGDAAAVGSGQFSYGTSNNQIADISPGGYLCAGTWNRNTGGGIADYTNCNYPSPLPATGGLPYAIAYVTATADSVTSNPIAIYIHAPVTAISLVTSSLSSAGQQCYSQNAQVNLDAQACYFSNGHQYQFCAPSSITPANYACAAGLAPGVTSVPSCGSSIGTLNYSVSNANVASITPVAVIDTPPYATQAYLTALQPGATSITATIAQSASSAGYFSTCPPKSINIALANGGTSGTVTQGVSQNLTTTVLDTNNNPINGLNLSYESTNPIVLSATGTGAITAAFPGLASVYAVCESQACNPAPINEIGLNGNGLSLTSNPVSITVPGTTSDYVWFAAPGQSQYFSSMELLNGNPGSSLRLPFVPDSMVMDQGGNNLYFGSPRELMIYATASNALTKQDTSAPGIVLAIAPDNQELVVNDQIRGLFYLYNTSTGPVSSYGGMGVAAAWTPDSNTLYIVDNALANSPSSCPNPLITGHTNALYVYNVNVGWSTYPLPPNPLPPAAMPTCTTQPDAPISATAQSVAITVPGIGAYIAGDPTTVAHTWCPAGTVGNNASIQFYPQSDSVSADTNVLGATSDGEHMLGASLLSSSISLYDIGLSIPPTATQLALCPESTGKPPNQVETMTPLSTNPTAPAQVNLGGVTNASAVNQVVTGAAPTSSSTTTAAPIAFITYTPNSPTNAGTLPYYLPQPLSSGVARPGPVNYVPFCQEVLPKANCSSGVPATPVPTAPLFGAFSPDGNIFFVSTAGDNLIHFITIPTNVNTTSAQPTDSQQFSPALPACDPLPPLGTGNDAGCLYPTAPPPNTFVPATIITVKPRSVT